MYRLVTITTQSKVEEFLVRTDDNAYIPFVPGNSDYQEYLEWLAEGNEPLPADE